MLLLVREGRVYKASYGPCIAKLLFSPNHNEAANLGVHKFVELHCGDRSIVRSDG
jgi:hypothetical protein